MRSSATFVGRIGALAVALGVGAVLGGCGIAVADTGSAEGSASDADASPRGPRHSSPGRGHPGQPSQAAPQEPTPDEAPVNTARSARAAAAAEVPEIDKSSAGHTPTVTAPPDSAVAAAPVIQQRVTPSAPSADPAPQYVPAPSAANFTAPPAAASPPPNPVAALAISLSPAAAGAPALTAAAPQGSISALPSALLGEGAGFPAESPATWAVLAATRRMGRVRTGRAAAATVTTGQVPGASATTTTTTTGTTTPITWAWGSYPVLNFNPATDKLDFGWMQAGQFDVSDKTGSTVITVVGNNHAYTLQGVTVGQLQLSNIVAKDAGTVSKWRNLISTAQATSAPTVSIANATVAEGNSATTDAAFAVTLSKASTKTVTVAYSTANGTATAGQDYTAASGTLTFAPGVTSQKVVVKVTGDTAVEPNETFAVKLAAPSGATLATATATGTITNDDVATVTPPTISIASSVVAEGNSGSTNMVFTVSLSKASDKTVTVGYSTANGTATAGQDYTAASGTLTFAPGSTTGQVNVSVIGDTAVEPTETVTVTLASPTNATVATATATGSITNDDTATPPSGTVDRWGKAFFAPYVDMAGWPVPNLLQISQATGATLLTAAFIQATPDGKPAWAGLSALAPDATNDQAVAINRAISDFRKAGGDVMISFGGAAGTSLAQYYASHGLSAQALANSYAKVIDTYGVTHIDFDVEGAAVADPASIALNSQAIKLLQQAKPEVQVWLTLPVLPTGLTADGLKVVGSALSAGVKIAGVNVMAMDYGESAAPTSGPSAQTMGTYAIRSAESTYNQLSAAYASGHEPYARRTQRYVALRRRHRPQSPAFPGHSDRRLDRRETDRERGRQDSGAGRFRSRGGARRNP
jgi:hypothetical protein